MHPDHTHQFLTSMLSIRISFPIFRMFILYTLSMHIRNWCMHWECATGNDAYPEHKCQELMCVLSICIRNWWVHWAYVPGTNACKERSPFKTSWAYASGTAAQCTPWAYASVSYAYAQLKRKNSKFEKVPSKHAEHMRKELISALSFQISNCCSRWAWASEIKWCQATSKQVTSSYFIPKNTYPERFYSVKIMKVHEIENLTLGHL